MNSRVFSLLLSLAMSAALHGAETSSIDHALLVLQFQAEKGNAAAQYELSHTSEVTPVESLKWLRAAAKGGSLEAQFELFSRYDTGDGLKADPDQALYWLRKAAGQNHLSAMVTLARRVSVGQGVYQDRARAAVLAKLAAQLGSAEAEFVLGNWYMDGTVFAQNRQEAFRHWKKAAEKGNSSAQFALANAYEQGWGTAKNPVESYFWRQMVVTRSPEAPEVAEATVGMRRLFTKVNVAQIAVIRLRVRDWKSSGSIRLASND